MLSFCGVVFFPFFLPDDGVCCWAKCFLVTFPETVFWWKCCYSMSTRKLNASSYFCLCSYPCRICSAIFIECQIVSVLTNVETISKCCLRWCWLLNQLAIFKDVWPFVGPTMLNIVNLSLKTGTVCTSFNTAADKPLLKKPHPDRGPLGIDLSSTIYFFQKY